MKKLLIILVLFFALFGANTYAMHQSWDLNLDGLNDCENEGNCDDSIKYTSPKIYKTSTDFLKSEGSICLQATDGCNNVMINNSQLGAMTKMYCDDIYGTNGQEKWSCNSYNTEKIDYLKYIRNNISNLTDKETVLGGTWYVVNINWISDDNIEVTFEDGHIQEKITLKKSDLVLNSNEEDMRVCTMQYEPVCAQVQVQCIMAPCYPVAETFGNSCTAGDNPIIHTGECNSYLDMTLYSKYEQMESKIYPKIEALNLLTLKKGVILVDKMIDQTKLMKMVQGALEKRTTGLIFIKHLFEKEINNRK